MKIVKKKDVSRLVPEQDRTGANYYKLYGRNVKIVGNVAMAPHTQ